MCIVLFYFGLIVDSVTTYEVVRHSYCYFILPLSSVLSLFSSLIRVALLSKSLVSHSFPLYCSPTSYIGNVPFLFSQFLKLLQDMLSHLV